MALHDAERVKPALLIGHCVGRERSLESGIQRSVDDHQVKLRVHHNRQLFNLLVKVEPKQRFNL